jgi:hypothetical protein
MDAQLTTTEINAVREVLQDYAPAKQALATLETHDGRLDTAFDQLWIEKNGSPPFLQDKSLWEVTLEVLRNELCGNDGFRAQVKQYTKNPGSTPLLTGLIVYLIGIAGMPIDPAIATVIVLYILKVGLNIFCKYTE